MRSHSSVDKITVSETYEISLKQKTSFAFLVSPNVTGEFCLTQCWTITEQSKIKMEIQFIGYEVDNNLILSSTNPTNKITFKNNFHSTSIALSLKFTKICQVFNVIDARLEELHKDKEDINNGRKSYRLLLTYKLKVTKINKFMFTLEGISEYSKYFDYISYQLSTESKKHITTFTKPRYISLERGITVICVQIGNSNLQMLEKLKTATLLVDQTLAEIEADLYDNVASAFNNEGNKFGSKVFQPGQRGAIYVASIPANKLPTSCPAGSYLEGTLSLSSYFDKCLDKSFTNFKIRYNFGIAKLLDSGYSKVT